MINNLFSNNRPFLQATSISIFVLVLIYLSIGIYFENYETYINDLLTGEYIAAKFTPSLMSTWVIFWPCFIYLSKILEIQYAYSTILLLLNLLVFQSFIYSILILFNKYKVNKLQRIISLGVFILFYAENLVYFHNNRLAILSIIASLVLQGVICLSNKSKRNYIYVIILLLIGLFTRLEIALITSAIFLLLSIVLYRKKQIVIFQLIVFSVALINLTSYKVIQKKYFYEDYIILEAEQVFFDRYSVSIKIEPNNKPDLILKAMAIFIQDEEVYSLVDYEVMLSKLGFVNYVKSERFFNIYLSKIEDTLYEMKPYIWYFLFSLLLYTNAIYLKYKRSDRKLLELFKSLGLTVTILLLIPLVINIYASVSVNFMLCCIFLLNLLSLIYLISIIKIINIKLQFFILFGFLISTVFRLHEIKFIETKQNSIYQYHRKRIVDIYNTGKTMVYLRPLSYENYPSELFPNYGQKISYYMADHMLSREKYFKEHQKIFFGETYKFLDKKLLRIYETNSILISDENQIEFTELYMRKIHGIEVGFEEYQFSDTLDSKSLKAYTINEYEKSI